MISPFKNTAPNFPIQGLSVEMFKRKDPILAHQNALEALFKQQWQNLLGLVAVVDLSDVSLVDQYCYRHRPADSFPAWIGRLPGYNDIGLMAVSVKPEDPESKFSVGLLLFRGEVVVHPGQLIGIFGILALQVFANIYEGSWDKHLVAQHAKKTSEFITFKELIVARLEYAIANYETLIPNYISSDFSK